MEQPIVSEERLQELIRRSKRCVCKYCGSKLQVRMLNFGNIETANMEIFCTECDKIEYGTEPEIYKNAVYFVDVMGFNAFPDREETEKTRRMNIAKVCDVISWHERQVGILGENGYTVELKSDDSMIDGADGSSIYTGESLWGSGDSNER